jgi:hypothetical protein
MEVSSLGNFTAAHKQTTEKNEESKDGRTLTSAQSQGTTTEEAQASPIPPVNHTNELSGEEGNITEPVSELSQAVDLIA